ncbi:MULTISPECIES: hypothetical protein [unclassified Streptomyces]|uniref:hypothetical protein n=1 Tax=unclassified Streptomyces TaxID=2593676 RepID=UPI003715B1E7
MTSHRTTLDRTAHEHTDLDDRRTDVTTAAGGATAARDTASGSAHGPAGRADAPDREAGTGRTGTTREADDMAVVSFLSGLVGLLVMNLVLGPIAIVLAGLALYRGTSRPGRARLGLVLGVADLAILAYLINADGTWSWSVG